MGVIPGGNCQDGSYPGWEFSLVGVFWVGIVQGESSRWQFSRWEFSCYLTCKDAGVKNQRNNSYDYASNICQEVTKICTLMREHNYLQNITELRQYTDVTSKIILINDLVNFTNIAFNNLKENLPKIL